MTICKRNSVQTLRKLFVLIGICLVFALRALPTNAQNGITVTEAKVYDDRTLMIMLEQLNEQLRNINFIDRTKLAAQLGLTQGFQSKDVSRSLDIGTLPIPGLTTKRTPDDSGNLTITEQTETRAGLTPAKPALPELQAPPNFNPVFGENAADLLSDQVNLTYQIFNLRMILERSLSDRLWTTDSGATYSPRLIAVIGFDIDLNPPKEARDYAAFVEITVAPVAAGAGAPSLVALMPQEKTYNSVALNTKSNAFGGSAVAKIFTIGYSERRRGQTFYLFRDTDTATLTYPQNGNSIHFGWIFRPVLGRRSVTSEKRHMFAVVALPRDDVLTQKAVFPVAVNAHTYWRRYNRDSLTTSLGEKFAYDFPITTNLLIPTTAKAQDALKPVINSVNWYATDDKNAVVTVEGQNFFTGTSVFVGSSAYDSEASGLLLKSSQNLQIKTTLSALTAGDPVLNPRYGATLPLEINDAITTAIPEGVKINEVRLRPQPGRKLVNLAIKLQNRDSTVGKNFTSGNAPSSKSLIVAVQGTPLAQPYDVQDITCDIPLTGGAVANGKGCVLVQALVPTDLLKNEAMISFRYPFRGSRWADSMAYYEPSEVSDVSRLGSKSKKTTLAISGRGFNDNWKIRVDQVYDKNTNPKVEFLGDTLMTLEIDDDALAGYKNLVVIPEFGDAIVKAIPPSKPPVPEPALDAAQATPNATVNTAPGIEFKGTDLGAITKVTFEGRELPFKAGKGGKSITVFLSRRVTAKPGTVQILLWAGDSIIPAKITVQP